MNSPTDRRYSKEHEWVRIDGTDCVVGISDHAQNLLGDIVYVELSAVEDEIDAKDEDKVASLPVPVPPSSGASVVPTDPIFVGTNEILSQWTTVIVEDGINYLLDKRTGEIVTGGLQVHAENGGISYF